MTDLAATIATYGLPHAGRSLPQRPLDAAAWQRLGHEVREQKLSGLLLAALLAGDLPATDEQYEEAREWHRLGVSVALLLDRQMLRVVPALEAAGHDVLVLKGPGVAHLSYPDPSLRLYGDIDILLRTDQFDDGIAVLTELGYDRPWSEIRPGFDARFGKGATLTAPDGLELDVHRTFAFGAFGLAIDVDEPFVDPTPFDVGGQRLHALGPAPRFLHACYHAALGNIRPRLMNLRDVAQLLPDERATAERALALAERWQGTAVVARALQTAERILGLQLEGTVADRVRGYTPTRREQRALASYVGTDPDFAAQVLASLPYVDGMRDRAAFVWAALVPSSEFLASRGRGGRAAWLRRGVALLRARMRP